MICFHLNQQVPQDSTKSVLPVAMSILIVQTEIEHGKKPDTDSELLTLSLSLSAWCRQSTAGNIFGNVRPLAPPESAGTPGAFRLLR
jgi:hypothetical protein